MKGFPEDLRTSLEPVRLLGSGGMGAVYLARDRGLDRLVAVKLVRGRQTEELRARFRREALLLARIEHPHVVRVLSCGICEAGPYMVLEYLEGRDLDQVEDPLPVVDVLLDVAAGLEAAHRAGVLHRDVKPANIMVTEGGRPVLVDFGLARAGLGPTLTRTGQILGTFGFMAPELLRGERASPASDFYSWGASLFALLEGRIPHDSAALLAAAEGQPLPELRFAQLPAEDPVAGLLRACLPRRARGVPPDACRARGLPGGR